MATAKTAQRQDARSHRTGRYTPMRQCARCGRRRELWPEYEPDGVTMTGRNICWECSPTGTAFQKHEEP